MAANLNLNFTTKREGHFGLGIGLSVSLQIVQQHHGQIEVASEPGRYTRMRVCLPLGISGWPTTGRAPPQRACGLSRRQHQSRGVPNHVAKEEQ